MMKEETRSWKVEDTINVFYLKAYDTKHSLQFKDEGPPSPLQGC